MLSCKKEERTKSSRVVRWRSGRQNRKGNVSAMAQRQRRWPSVQKADRTSLTKLFDDYKGGKEMPLAGYASLLGIFGVALTGVLIATRGADDPTRMEASRARFSDLLLMGVATHKLS